MFISNFDHFYFRLKNYFSFNYVEEHVSVWVCTHEFRYQQRTEEGTVDRNSRTRVLQGFELADVGVERKMWVLYSKSSIVLNC